ncbi:kinase-like domain-containing protein [Roridomyces roridus]|uniref:Kinase-like domain-containing protein n=1 Tax=Roridomyces roridus TaxID=1738132 RepID=A0AAD7BX52_9AGAR|nr:kinase-like domain-containing protein [Roridomyces roridus]
MLRVVNELKTPLRRGFSSVNLYNYTSGRWVYNDALRHKERRAVFHVDGLESVNQTFNDVVRLSKLAEGGFNRTFLISLRDGRQVVARVPYPMTAPIPNYYAVASEDQRSCGIPVPEIYGYSADSDNIAGIPYILMEFVHGPSSLTQLEAKMMSHSFPAGGSLYLASDLEKVATVGVPLEDKRFCVGPDTKLSLWHGRRAGLNVGRGPYHSAEAALMGAAQKELAYLKQFGQPLLPLRRERRPIFKYQAQSPSDHVENLERYLGITASLVPRDPALSRFCIRHPDLQPNNIFVSWSPDSDCKIVSLFDWQHTSIPPMFLLAGIPQRLQNHADDVSHSMIVPSRPDNIDEMDEAQRDNEEYRYRCRLVHYHYVTSTKKLFLHAGGPWTGETLDLKVALIEAKNRWEELAGRGALCPFDFDATDVEETMAMEEVMIKMTRGFEILQSMQDVGEEGWVLAEDYERAVAFFKEYKEEALAGAETAEEREEILGHWPWDDMDEEMYM